MKAISSDTEPKISESEGVRTSLTVKLLLEPTEN